MTESVDIVFFDAGGTLVYPAKGVGATYADAARRHGFSADSRALEMAFHATLREKRGKGTFQDREWWRDVVRRTFERAGETHDVEAIFAEVYDHFSGPAAWRPFPDAVEITAEIRRRGYRTGLISNWDARLPRVLAGTGFLPGLDPLVISGEVGAEKPDPRIFRTALERAGVPADQALMVGDDPEADVEGARAVGMRAVLVAPGQDDGAEPGEGLSLRGLLDRLPGRPPSLP